jgi:hypothetical protein
MKRFGALAAMAAVIFSLAMFAGVLQACPAVNVGGGVVSSSIVSNGVIGSHFVTNGFVAPAVTLVQPSFAVQHFQSFAIPSVVATPLIVQQHVLQQNVFRQPLIRQRVRVPSTVIRSRQVIRGGGFF